MWDLDAASDATHDGRGSVTHQPLGTVQKYVVTLSESTEMLQVLLTSLDLLPLTLMA